MGSSATIRSFAAHDRVALVDVWVRSWQATLMGIDFEARRDWFKIYLSELQAAGAETLCAENPDLVGFVVLDALAGCVHQIAVRPDRFGTGIGLCLLDAAKRRCPQRLALTVNQDNPRAVRFYEREGFVTVGSGVSPNSGLRTWDMVWTATTSPPAGHAAR